MISHIVKQESEFEKIISLRIKEVENIEHSFLRERAANSVKSKIDTFYKITDSGSKRYQRILDEELT